MSRRRFLAGLTPASVALVLMGCEDDPNLLRITPTSTPSHPVAVATGAAGQPPRIPEPIALNLPRAPLAQGGAFAAILTGEGIVSAVAEFGGRQIPAVHEGGLWLSMIGVGQLIGSVQQLAPGMHPVRMWYDIAGEREPHMLEGPVTVTTTAFPIEALTLAPGVASLLDPALIEQETTILRATYGAVTPARLWDGYFARPSPADITDVYGSRRSFNGGPATGSHSGVDFGATTGAPARAAARGRVALAQPLPVRGNTVILDHGAGVFTGYCHLSAFAVDAGEEVAVGDRIGSIGATGLATGAHLHWEVVAGGMHVDGLRWLHE